jgi:hypothetical protein
MTGTGSSAVKESVRVTVCSEKKDGTPNIGDHKVMVLQRSAGVTDTLGKAQGKLKMKKKAKVCVCIFSEYIYAYVVLAHELACANLYALLRIAVVTVVQSSASALGARMYSIAR